MAHRVSDRFSLRLNGREVQFTAPPAYTLLEVLREILDVTGPKDDCAKGECGACTVLMNGSPVCSCLIIMAQAAGADIVSAEGLVKNGKPSVVQEAFVTEGAVQCGHCIPGMVVSTTALLARNSNPKVNEIKTALSGNLCRCTGYAKIIQAVLKAGELKAKSPK